MIHATKNLKILVVEDRKEDFDLVKENLAAIGITRPKLAMSLDNVKKMVTENTFDLIMLDMGLEDTQGVDTVRSLQTILSSLKIDIPIIVLSGMANVSLNKKVLKMGPKDYLIKGEYEASDLQRSISFATFCQENPKRGKGLTQMFKKTK